MSRVDSHPELQTAWQPAVDAALAANDLKAYNAYIFVLRWPRVEVHRSASRHGVSDDDVLHAVEHEMVSFELDPDADPPKVLVIGPDSARNLLEVIVIVLADDRMIAIHAMKLRRHFYELLPGEEGSP